MSIPHGPRARTLTAWRLLPLLILGACASAPPPAATASGGTELPPDACVPAPSPTGAVLRAVPRGTRLTTGLRVTVSPTGQVSQVSVRESSGVPLFDRWAQDAVAQWKCPVSGLAESVEATTSISVAVD